MESVNAVSRRHAAAMLTFRDGDDDAAALCRLRDGTRVQVVKSSPDRWARGGYDTHHYVPEPPGPHGVYFELELERGGGDDNNGDGAGQGGGCGGVGVDVGEVPGGSGVGRSKLTLT